MTVRQSTNGEILRLGYKDWLGLLMIIVSGVIALGTRMEMLDRNSEVRVKELREEMHVAAPAPAKWTVDAVNRIDGEIVDLRHAIQDVTRIDTNQKAVMQKQEQMSAKQDAMMEGIAENKAILMMLKDKFGLGLRE